MDLYPLILESTNLQQAAEINSTRNVKASDVNFPNYKNYRIIISNLCKMFWLLSHKHYRILSLLILTEIMIMTSLINKLTYTLRHKSYIKSKMSISMDLYPLILESTNLQQAAEINSTRNVKASDVNFPLRDIQ
jgi:hypothetical protein